MAEDMFVRYTSWSGLMIRFWRGFLVVSAFVVFGIASLILGLIYIPIGKIFIKNKRKTFSHLIHKLWCSYTHFLMWLRIFKLNLYNITPLNGKIIVATHPSFIDILILIGLYDNSLCLAKKELLNNIFLKNIIKNVYIPNNIELDEFKQICTDALNDGYNIIIFPTGTRTCKGEELKIHKGAAALQISSGVDIIPIKMECDYSFLQKGKPIYDAGDKTITYKISQLAPIKLKDFGEKSEIKLRNAISEKIKFDFTR